MVEAAAVAESAPAPIPQAAPDEEIVTAPEPLKSHVDKAPEPEKPVSTRDALKAAREKVEAEDKTTPKPVAEKIAKVELKAKVEPEAKPVEKPRGEHGHFATAKTDAENAAAEEAAKSKVESKPPAPGQPDHRVPPTRYSAEAKAGWDATPDPVKMETHRAFRELEAGIQKYREPATRYETTFKQFDDIAQQSGIPVEKRAAVLNEYISLDRGLNDPKTFVPTVEKILNGRGVTLQQFAEHVLGQRGQAPQSKTAEQIALERIEQRLDNREKAEQERNRQQQTNQLAQQVDTWSKGKEHFDMLADRIAQIIISDRLSPDDAYAKALTEAQELARAFNGDSGSEPSPKPAAALSAEEIADQTRKGSKSIKGAPGSGSAPATAKASSSIRDALRRAQARV